MKRIVLSVCAAVMLSAHADKHFLYWTGDLVGVSGSLYDPIITCSLADAPAGRLRARASFAPKVVS